MKPPPKVSNRAATSSSVRWTGRAPTTPTTPTTPNRHDLAGQLASEFAVAFGRTRSAGGFGSGEIRSHIAHALAYLDAYPGLADAERVLDLGSGDGLPGLVLARQLPAATFVLLDGRVERSKALARSVAELGLAERVAVIAERAEVAAHRASLRFHFDAVVARSFGRPAVTAECGAGFLKLGGAFIISEPPETAEDRWPSTGLAQLGLALESSASRPLHFAVLRAVAPLDERYPRRVGIPTKRPLF